MGELKVQTLNLVNDTDEYLIVTDEACVILGDHEHLVASFATAMNQDEVFRRIVLDAFALLADNSISDAREV